MKRIIKENSIAVLFHFIITIMAAGTVVLVRFCADDLNADWLVTILFVVFYIGLIWLYVQAGALLPFKQQRKKEWMDGIGIVIIGVIIWIVAVMQNGLGVIDITTQKVWMLEFFYCIGAWPLLQVFPYPIVWLAAPVAPALFMLIGMYRKRKQIDEELLKQL